jgi:hypothetical protein
MKMNIKAVLLIIILSPLITLSQKTKVDKGILYCTLGSDTTLIQSFEFSNNKFKSTFIQFTGAITKCEAAGTLDDSGDLLEVNSTNYKINETGNWELTSTANNKFNGDSLIYLAIGPKGETVNRRSFPGKGILANGMDIASFYNFAYMAYYAPSKTGDTIFHRQLSSIGIRKFAVTRLNKNEVRIGSTLMGYLTLVTDGQNHLQKIEGVGSSLNITGSVVRENINNNIPDEIAKRRNAAGATTVRTLRDTAHIVLNDNIIEVDYWRPHKRGREIFGNVVPWGRPWRTGANNATQLRFTKDISISGKDLAAGKYGIWSLPTSESQWELLINKNANNWGTDYDAASDLLKLPLRIERTDIPVEILKISLTKKDNSTATLIIEWDTFKGSIDITTK